MGNRGDFGNVSRENENTDPSGGSLDAVKAFSIHNVLFAAPQGPGPTGNHPGYSTSLQPDQRNKRRVIEAGMISKNNTFAFSPSCYI